MSKTKTITVTLTDLPDGKIDIKMNCDKDVKVMEVIRVFGSLVEVHTDSLTNYVTEKDIKTDEAVEAVALSDFQ